MKASNAMMLIVLYLALTTNTWEACGNPSMGGGVEFKTVTKTTIDLDETMEFPIFHRKRRETYWPQQHAAQKQAQSFLELILGVIDTLQFGKRKLGTPS